MIIPDDKRKIASIIVSKRSSKGEPLSKAPMKREIVKDEDGEMDGRHEAAADIIAAHHEKSPEKLMHALANFIDMHHSKASEQKEE